MQNQFNKDTQQKNTEQESDDSMDDFIVDHNPRLDRIYREADSDEESGEEKGIDPKLKKIKRNEVKFIIGLI